MIVNWNLNFYIILQLSLTGRSCWLTRFWGRKSSWVSTKAIWLFWSWWERTPLHFNLGSLVAVSHSFSLPWQAFLSYSLFSASHLHSYWLHYHFVAEDFKSITRCFCIECAAPSSSSFSFDVVKEISLKLCINSL